MPSLLEQQTTLPPVPVEEELPPMLPATSPGVDSSVGDADDLFNTDLPSVSSVGSLADKVVSTCERCKCSTTRDVIFTLFKHLKELVCQSIQLEVRNATFLFRNLQANEDMEVLDEEELEEKRWGKRTQQLLHIINRNLVRGDACGFKDLTLRKNRKQVRG